MIWRGASGADGRGPGGRARLAGLFASVALHLALIAVIQVAAQRDPATPPQEPPVQIVELTPLLLEPPPEPLPPPPEPVAPEPPPPPPEPEPAPPPEPETRADIPEPAPEPEPAPAPQPEPPVREAQTIAPPAEGDSGVAIPGLRYRDGRERGTLAAFGHAVECLSLHIRYEDYCADVGPIYVTENVERLAPEAEQAWRDMMARRAARGVAMDPVEACDGPQSNLGTSACIPPSEQLRQRGNRLRDVLP